ARQVQGVLAGRGARAVRQPLRPARDQSRRRDPRRHARGQLRRPVLLPAGDGVGGRRVHHGLRVQRPDRRGDGTQDRSHGRLRRLPRLHAGPGGRRCPVRRRRALLRLGGGGAHLRGPLPRRAGDGGRHVVRPRQGRPPGVRLQGRRGRAPGPPRRVPRPGVPRRRPRPALAPPRGAVGAGRRSHGDRRPADLDRTAPGARAGPLHGL
ncbi:MAG: Phosphatidylinositol phosphate synthase @ Archaetidylinositol phosphate synthase, partial [uncultured Nocardioides sp.]